MNVWLEVHVDDEVLTRDPGAWPESAALLDKLATAAESVGGRLSFRVRSRFAAQDRFGFLRGLALRGHEIGAHAHGRDLEAAVAALRAAGIQPTVMAPGLVQVGLRGEAALLGTALALGATGITDRLEARCWTYQGWLPRRHASGLWMLDVSVSPFVWGVLRPSPSGPQPAWGNLDWAALDRSARVQAAQFAPEGWTPFFGATFHEHDLCPPRSLSPTDPSFDGLRRWVAAWSPRASAAAALGPTLEEPAAGGAHAAPTRQSGVSRATILGVKAALSHTRTVEPTGKLPAHRTVVGAAPRVAVVAVHAGEGGLVERLRFLGLSDRGFGPRVSLWLYARRAAGWAAPGNPSHVADARLVLERALGDGLPGVILSWSGGCVSAARALLELHRERPDLASRVAAFVDVEGPVDRHSLVKPGNEAEWAAFSPHDDAPWRGRELVALFAELAALPSPPAYHRWQGTPDHVHGACTLHADRAVAAARRAGLVATVTRVQGSLRDHPEVWAETMRGVTDAAAARSSDGSPPAVAPGGDRPRAPAR